MWLSELKRLHRRYFHNQIARDQAERTQPRDLDIGFSSSIWSRLLIVKYGQRQRSQQRGPKAGPEQCWIKEPVKPLILSRLSILHTYYTYWLNQLHWDKHQGRQRECVRDLWGVYGDWWEVVSCWVMLRDGVVEDGASRDEKHPSMTLVRYLEASRRLWLGGGEICRS